MKKILITILLITTIVVIVPVILFFLFLGALSFDPITKFNTVYTKSFKIVVWEEEIKSNISRGAVQNLLGKPLKVHKQQDVIFILNQKLVG